MSTTKRVLLGLMVLGVVGLHALGMTGCTTAVHHVVDAAPAASPMHVDGHHGDHGDHENGSGPLLLCVALLIALVVTAVGGRRTTWVSLLDRRARSLRLPLPPVLRDGAPVPRFTVMRC